MYRYFGMVFGRLTVKLMLGSCTLPGESSHAAVWAGVNNRNLDWLQAGIERSAGDATPMAYIEAGLGGKQVRFRSWPFETGRTLTVKLRRIGKGTWSVSAKGGPVDEHGAMKISGRPTIDAMLEVFDGASAVGKINSKTVKGGK